MYSGGNGVGEEGVDERSGWEQWLWLDAGDRWIGHRRDRPHRPVIESRSDNLLYDDILLATR